MADEIDVGMKCIKYMLFVANFMFVMIGFLLISIGTTIKTIYEDFDLFMETHYFSPSILVIVIGVTIFLVAILGCVGAIKESTCLINLFGLFLGLLLIMEISAAIAAYAMRDQVECGIREKMNYSINNYYSDPYDRDMWDFTQQRLYCCGVESSQDWSRVNASSRVLPKLQINDDDSTTVTSTTTTSTTSTTTKPTNIFEGPETCCNFRDFDRDGFCDSKYVYRDGCLEVLSYIVSESALLLGCGALAVAFIQFLGVIFAWMLAKAVRRLKTQKLVTRNENRQRIYEQMARGEEEKNSTPVLYTPTFSEA